jgi:hypothetical protein
VVEKMADVFSKRKRSEVMSRIRGRGQKPKSCGVRPDWRTLQLPVVTSGKWRVTRKLRALGLKIKFNRLLQIGHGFLPRGSEAGHVHVQTLGDKKFVLPVNDVVHLFHIMNLSAWRRIATMPDVFSKAKRSKVMSRIRADLRQPFGRAGEIAPDESGSQRVGAVGLIENPHAPYFGSACSKMRGNISEAQPAGLKAGKRRLKYD